MNNDRFKFRVWNKSRCEYHIGAFGLSPSGELLVEWVMGFIKYPDPYVIEQCTGLKDKNGKLIYEGDMIRSPSKIRRGIVRWCGGSTKCLSGMWVVKCRKEKMPELFSSEWEIVGNIHEPKWGIDGYTGCNGCNGNDGKSEVKE